LRPRAGRAARRIRALTSRKNDHGKDGTHQIINRTDAPIRVLMLSSMRRPDIVHSGDIGKVFARDAEGEPIILARPEPTVEYWEGEE
jgi:uncharacterized cupin superfamily protein